MNKTFRRIGLLFYLRFLPPRDAGGTAALGGGTERFCCCLLLFAVAVGVGATAGAGAAEIGISLLV